MKLLKKGAEADIFEVDSEIHKVRISKGYRIRELDTRLRKSRTKAEATTLRKLKAGVNVPAIVREDLTNYTLVLEKIEGVPVKDYLSEKNYKDVAKGIAEQVAAIHALDVVHGDLTTSNMISTNGKICLIDFGLSYTSLKVEDKAVDLHLFEEVLESTHVGFGKEMFQAFLGNYVKRYSKGKAVVARLETLRKKGRYKEHE